MLGPEDILSGIRLFLRYLDTKSHVNNCGSAFFDVHKILPYSMQSVLKQQRTFYQIAAMEETKEMWTAIERLQQGESLNVQDVKTNLFWEFGKFTSRDGESIDLILRPTQRQRDRQTSYYLLNLSPFLKETVDPEQAQRDKDMQKNLALLAKYFKKLYKPTNNNLRTSSNSRNKTEDTTPSALTARRLGTTKTRECWNPKRSKDTLSQRKKMMNVQDKQNKEVSPAESSSTDTPLEQVQNHDENDVFANLRRHSEQPEIH
ncbi:hypothetical protein Tco_0478915 [Tanacetum coccineum]